MKLAFIAPVRLALMHTCSQNANKYKFILPSSTSNREVTTLWHEFGHGLQHMLTNVPYTDAAGISGVEWDAVELPSQMMENFIMSPSIISTITKHHETGATLPQVRHA